MVCGEGVKDVVCEVFNDETRSFQMKALLSLFCIHDFSFLFQLICMVSRIIMQKYF